MSNPNPQQSIKIEDLTIQQLEALKDQFDSDISNLTKLYSKLKQAKAAFIECNSCIDTINPHIANSSSDQPIPTKKSVLVPLTNSLYVRGTLKHEDKVIVDIGTGYFVEKDCQAAKVFYNKKIEYIQENSDKLYANIVEKQKNLKALLEIIQQKAISTIQQQKNSKP
ncbi:Prefoldin subunit 5 [Smittium mucronatum]|uniref:Prefoldin subunit 5 n=1 Tax=Smittium mucronatum TaxID=133383 RepID=A0A1R0H948_9FUNG|nr:Prefoldin subunit 5 [Smittium mucronatum]